MAIDVKFLPEDHIESAALCLLSEYGQKFSVVEKPPVPVDEILESLRGLSLEIDDLPARLGIRDVLGATWINEKRVAVDESLDPDVHKNKEGRYRFTIAHELGHWDLHRGYLLKDTNQGTMFGGKASPSVVCRSKARDPMEWQANAFAAHLLMPEAMVREAWSSVWQSDEPYIAAEEIAVNAQKWGLGEDSSPTVDIAWQMAEIFKVSGQAMQIRLMGLKLILDEAPEPGLF